ncbi:type VI secretion system contractile sheath large subunit [Phycisphaeraceae bacterium D3-23]
MDHPTQTTHAPSTAAPAAAEGVGAAGPGSLLDQVVAATARDASWLHAFLDETDWVKALAIWLRQRGTLRPGALSPAAIAGAIDVDIAEIDRLLTRQANAIIHHPKFQRLEASWRGLEYTVHCADQDAEGVVLTRVLDITWKELERDAERAVEFDQTHFWRKVYEEEYGMPGGLPFGVLIGDYQVRHRPTAEHPHDDVALLRSIAQTAASAFVPFITAADPGLLGLDHFNQLDRGIDLDRVFNQPEYTKWNTLRREPDMKFVGITAPQTLMRTPYREAYTNAPWPSCPHCGRGLAARPVESARCSACDQPVEPTGPNAPVDRMLGFRFREQAAGDDESNHLWGSAAYAFTGVLIRAFSESRWLADIRGFDRDQVGGGVVPDLPSPSFGMDRPGVAPKMATEVAIDDAQEKMLADHGLIPLSHCHDTDWHVFYSNSSLHQPAVYNDPDVSLNAQISSMLQYTLCASRFSHYLKVQMRERVGSRAEAMELQNKMGEWINDYVTQDSMASASVKAQYPLREAEVEVVETPGRPGVYQCVMKLWPHYQLDEVSMSIRMITPVSAGRGQ